MLRIQHLVKTFANGEDKLYAVNDVSTVIDDHAFVVILGESGSGKTTFLNLVSGLEKADSGSVEYDGEDIQKLNDRKMTEFRRNQVAFVFQQYYLLPALTVYENIRMGGDLAGNREIEPIIEALGLTGKERNLPSQLSGGQQQRVSIARALAKRPKVLFCDEPTGALDEGTGNEVLRYLKEMQKEFGFTVVMVTHNQAISTLATKVIHMSCGKITEDYTC